MRVLFTSLRNSSHFLPLVPFIDACRRRGHEVGVAAPAELQIAELGLARHPASAALQQTRERALTTLRDIYSQTNPFRFIVYSELAGRGLAPVVLSTPGGR
jgi:hypothetical protein